MDSSFAAGDETRAPERDGFVRRFVRALAGAEAWHGAIVLAAFVLAFLWTPLSRYEETYYSSADLFQDFSLMRVTPGHAAGNKLMSDEVTEMQPWAMFNRDELRAGRVPLWNPWNGAGAPHFANYQSAVFSPFTAPWYWLGTKDALLVTAFMKLWACGFFTFLFLKKLGLRQIPALVGATAFMFSGHNVLLLTFPHVAAQAVLPAGCYFAECVLQRFESWARAFPGARSLAPTPGSAGPFGAERMTGSPAQPSLRGPLLGLALTFWIALLAGQPEVFYFSFLLIAAFIAMRLIGILHATRGSAGAVQRLLALAGKFAFAGLVAAGLSAFQLLPFFEFLQNSRLFEQRSHVQTPLGTSYWPLMLFPDLVGNPSTTYVITHAIPSPNYELVNMAYIGGIVVFAALLSLLYVHVDRLIAFFALAATAWVFYAYDLLGAAKLFALIPTVDLAPMNRSQGVWLFCLAVLAALALDRMMAAACGRRFVFATGTVLAGLVCLATCLIGGDRVIEEVAQIPSNNHDQFAAFVPEHVRSMSEIFGAGVLALALLWLVRARWAQAVCGLAVLVCTFLASGWLMRNYNPVTEDRYFFPMTPALHELTAYVGDERLAILGEDKLPPDSNLPYRLQTIDNYDGMWVQHYDHLYRDQFGDTHNWRPMIRSNERALKLFGVQWVLAKWGWNFTDAGLHNFPRADEQQFIPHEIALGGTVAQTFLVHDAGLETIAIWLGTNPNAKEQTIEFTLEDVEANKVVTRQKLTLEEVRSTLGTSRHVSWTTELKTNPAGRYVVFKFAPIAGSKGRTYKWSLSSEARTQGIYAFSTQLLGYGQGQASWKGKPLKGETLFDFRCDFGGFEEKARIGDYVLYRYKSALPICHVVRGAMIAETNEEALALVRSPRFNPAEIVVLSDDERLPDSVRAQLGPAGNRHRRLVKFEGDDRIYVVEDAQKRLVHIQNEVVFLINKFDWKQVETVPADDFAGWERTFQDRQAQLDAGLRVVMPEVRGQTPLKLVEETPTKRVMELDQLWPSYVVISQAWFPGWKAYIDGEEVPVWRANYAFNAIAVPAGSNHIEFVYEPENLRAGLWIGVLSLGVGVGGLVRRRRK